MVDDVMQSIEQTRKDMLRCYAAAVQRVEGTHVVSSTLPVILHQQFASDELRQLRIVAIGKAADAMLQGALACLDAHPVKALLISKTGHVSRKLQLDSRVQWLEAAHPVPDQSSLHAGQALLDFLRAEDSSPCLFLISGGASSLVEVLAEGWDLPELQQMTNWMLANALSIQQINTVRKQVSRIKGGGLWKILGYRKVVCLMISDVPGDDAEMIGSGLLFPSTISSPVPDSLPDRWRNALPLTSQLTMPDAFFWKVIACNRMAGDAASAKAIALGYNSRLMPDFLQGNAEQAARHCLSIAKKSPGTMFIWGAETTVTLPDNPGRGGRNQHLALAAALLIKKNTGCVLLAAGTDGTDGITDDAGALVDAGTLARGKLHGLDAKQCLRRADSGSFLYASGDLISTGVTGTNVMDLIITYCQKP